MHSCGKHCEKRGNCSQQAISPFLKMFSTLYGTYISFLMHFKMSSAIYLNLDKSKILSSDNALMDPIQCNDLPSSMHYGDTLSPILQ